eukprot:GILK01011307.1.p1 GENE.GILK01011307.1~~GILK01011307.1.p1  ORF type:complete len:252 (+),score=20.19 GILK01011307.1:47-757(+)
MPDYGSVEYWNTRYREKEGSLFDWLENYESLAPFISQLVDKDARVLVIGCGNAQFSEDMYDDGYQTILNIDISPVVIEQMKARNTKRDKMLWQVMDVRDLDYPSNFFDVVIDKSTMDSILCGEMAFINVARMTKEIQRVLRIGGYYLIISYGHPENRVLHLEMPHLKWSIHQLKLEPSSELFTQDALDAEEQRHFCYLCQKEPGADEVCAKAWYIVESQLLEEDSPEGTANAELET